MNKEILDKLNNKAEHYILYDYEVKTLLDYIDYLEQEKEKRKYDLCFIEHLKKDKEKLKQKLALIEGKNENK